MSIKSCAAFPPDTSAAISIRAWHEQALCLPERGQQRADLSGPVFFFDSILNFYIEKVTVPAWKAAQRAALKSIPLHDLTHEILYGQIPLVYVKEVKTNRNDPVRKWLSFADFPS